MGQAFFYMNIYLKKRDYYRKLTLLLSLAIATIHMSSRE